MNREEFESRSERLYDRAISGQWDAERAIPWDVTVNADEVTLRAPLITGAMEERWPTMSAALRRELVRLCLGTLLTNLSVGEAFVDTSTAELADRLPNRALRGLVALQAVDEARHEQVLLRYVREKLELDSVPAGYIAARRLPEGTQIARESWQSTALLVLILEIAALASIQGIREYCDEPLLQQMLRRVVSDESRHISGLVLSLRDPGWMLDDAQRSRLKDVVVLGWRQGLAVTEKPVLKVAQMLAGDASETPHPEWFYFRRMIGSTLVPKLKLFGLYDADLEARLEAAGCPLQTGGISLEAAV